MTEPKGPEQCYCLANRRGARHLARMYDRHLAPAGINAQQFSILSLIGFNGTMTVMALARAMEMERTTLVRALKPLQTAKWVLSRSPKEGRAMEFSLSASGKRKADEAGPMWRAAQVEFEEEFGRDRAIALRAALLEIGRSEGATE